MIIKVVTEMIRTLPKSLVESATALYESMLLEDRIDFLKEKNPTIDMSHETNMSRQIPASALIDHLASHADPTKNKQHTQWILGQYKKKNIRVEDAPRIKDTLSNFEKYKSKLPKKDINQYKTVGEINDAVHPHLGSATTNKEVNAEIHEKGRTLVHSAPDGTKVYRLEPNEHGKKASQDIYGGGSSGGGTHTDWCTAARSERCMFNTYSKKGNELHTIHTPDGSVYQAHVDSDQIMNNRDENVDGVIKSNNDETMVDHPHAMHISRALDHIPDGHLLKITHKLPGLSHDDISKALTHPDYGVRQVAAEHPNASKHHIDTAIQDDSEYVRRAAIKNKNATMEHINAGLHDKSSMVVEQAIKKSPYDSAHLESMYDNAHTDDKTFIRKAIVSHPNASNELITKGMHDKNSDVREAAIKNPIASKEHLISTLSHSDRNLVQHAISHPNADSQFIAEVLTKKTGNDNSTIRWVALQHKNLSPHAINLGLADENTTNVQQTLKHKNITPEHINIALDHPDHRVRMIAISHKNATPENINKGLLDTDARVAVGAAKHKNASYDNLMKALDRPEKEVKNSAVENFNSTEDHVRKAMKDSDPDVRDNAKGMGQLIMGMDV